MPAYKDGDKWFAQFYYTDFDGVKKRKKKRGFNTKKEALEYERIMITKMDGSNANLTLSDLCDLFLEDRQMRVKPTTYSNYEGYIENRIKPYFKDRLAVDIKPIDIRHWQNLLAKDCTKNSIHTYHDCLVSIFAYGMKFYGLKTNPAKETGNVAKPQKQEIKFWTYEQYCHFRNFVKKEEDLIFYDVLYYSGMRVGEAMGLKWDDIDFENNKIRIDENYSYVRGVGYIFQSPKTPKSRRKILMPIKIMEELKTLSKRKIKGEQRVFYYVTDKNSALRKFQRTQEKAELPIIGFHDMRHSHASLMINCGSPVVLVSERLGHEDVATTLKVYTHLFPTKEEELVEKLDREFPIVPK